MFIEKRKRGRPPGPTERGLASKEQLQAVATRMFAERGYQATTLREIARAAGVSPGLLYRYFPSKRAVVLALYDDLSAEYAARAEQLAPGPWATRFLFALETSLAVLQPRRDTLAALFTVLLGDREEGIFAPVTAFSRERVQAVFHQAVAGATDAPPPADAAALGRVLYVAHLALISWWLLDRSPGQRATTGLIAAARGALPAAAFALRLPPARALIHTADALCREALFRDAAPESGTDGSEPR